LDPPLFRAGVVRDILGRGVPGVEIIVSPLGRRAPDSPGIIQTDGNGRFSLEGLEPGNYLLAVHKPGYNILIAQAHSRLLSLLQLRLRPEHPGVGTPESTGADAMDWVLRLPRTDILKEEKQPVPGQVFSEGERASGSEGGIIGAAYAAFSEGELPVSGDVSQWYSSTLQGVGAGPDAPESTGRSTALQVGGGLLGRGTWEVRGLSQNRTTGGGVSSAGGSEEDQAANRLRLAMHYSVTPEDSLRVRARFDRDRFHSDGASEEIIHSRQEVRTLGYEANWSRRMGEQSGLEIELGYLQAQAHLPGNPDLGTVAGEEKGELEDWRWNAGAGYQVQLSPEHRLSAAARTRLYRSDQREAGWIQTPIRSDLFMLETGNKGWTVSLSSEDSWRISEPVSLILGLDTHVSQSLDRTVILVPRLGARSEGDRHAFQGWVLLRTDSLGYLDGGGAAGPGREGTDSSPLGYRAEVLRRFPGNLVVRGHLERNPLGAAVLGQPWLSDASNLETLLVADPGAWSREVGFFVSKNLRGVEGSVESNHGRVVGKVAGVLSEAPVRVLEEGGVRYLAFRATASVEWTDTQVRLDYLRLAEMDSYEAVQSGACSSRVDLTVLQPIPLVSNRGAGSWRVLFGYQALTRDRGAGPEVLEASEPERIQRFSGGVGVSF